MLKSRSVAILPPEEVGFLLILRVDLIIKLVAWLRGTVTRNRACVAGIEGKVRVTSHASCYKQSHPAKIASTRDFLHIRLYKAKNCIYYMAHTYQCQSFQNDCSFLPRTVLLSCGGMNQSIQESGVASTSFSSSCPKFPRRWSTDLARCPTRS